jgi:hypothetical protein
MGSSAADSRLIQSFAKERIRRLQRETASTWCQDYGQIGLMRLRLPPHITPIAPTSGRKGDANLC